MPETILAAWKEKEIVKTDHLLEYIFTLQSELTNANFCPENCNPIRSQVSNMLIHHFFEIPSFSRERRERKKWRVFNFDMQIVKFLCYFVRQHTNCKERQVKL